MPIHRNNNLVLINRFYLMDKSLSLSAKGLFTVILSNKGQRISTKELASLCKENELTINSLVNELKNFGYLKLYQEIHGEEFLDVVEESNYMESK